MNDNGATVNIINYHQCVKIMELHVLMLYRSYRICLCFFYFWKGSLKGFIGQKDIIPRLQDLSLEEQSSHGKNVPKQYSHVLIQSCILNKSDI